MHVPGVSVRVTQMEKRLMQVGYTPVYADVIAPAPAAAGAAGGVWESPVHLGDYSHVDTSQQSPPSLALADARQLSTIVTVVHTLLPCYTPVGTHTRARARTWCWRSRGMRC